MVAELRTAHVESVYPKIEDITIEEQPFECERRNIGEISCFLTDTYLRRQCKVVYQMLMVNRVLQA